MNTQTADRLLKYRKANGYSQEELAAKIGVSRQAISKWERGESSPDTDNLIALAKLYSVSIDEMINGTDDIHKAQDKSSDSEISFKNGIHVHSGADNVDISLKGIHVETQKGESVHIGGGCGVQVNGIDETEIGKRNAGLAHAILPVCIIIAYLIIGFTFERGWALGWLLFFIIPIIESFIAAVKSKNPSAFAYPVFTAAVYLTIGMFMGIWHPTWIIFITIPIYYIIAELIRPKNKEVTNK